MAPGPRASILAGRRSARSMINSGGRARRAPYTMKKTADICDANEGVEACVTPMRSWGRRREFFGLIRTVRVHRDYGLVRDTLSKDGEGCVLVVDGGGLLDRAIFGDVMAGRAVKNGWSGVILHGAIRDSGEIDLMDIGIRAPGTMPLRGTAVGTGEVDIPVTFGNATFTPGRLLVVDEDGIIVCPSGNLSLLN